MNSDSYFEIGCSHIVCQDYALSGSFKDMHYGIVSDGCSSAEHSEIGAQIMCHVARYHIQLYYDLFFKAEDPVLLSLLGNSILKRADEIRKIYPITVNALQATLLILVAKENKACVFGWGDGYVLMGPSALRSEISYRKMDYPENNAPFYLSTNRNDYINEFGPDIKVCYTGGSLGYKGARPGHPAECAYSTRIERSPFDTPFFQSYLNISQGQTIAVTTDGLGQYLNENKKPIPDIEIMPLIMDYPNPQGIFVKRTMNFLKRELITKNWSHSDDIGLATIII